MDQKSSKMDLRVLFTSIKRNFFQKVAFYTNQTDFWVGFFQNATFGLKMLKQMGTNLSNQSVNFWTMGN